MFNARTEDKARHVVTAPAPKKKMMTYPEERDRYSRLKVSLQVSGCK